MIRVYRIPFSTNVERVALAAGHKGIDLEWVDVDPADRTAVIEVSRQDRVPVAVFEDGRVLPDSTAILEELELRYPEPALYPRDEARRAEAVVFVDWFNRVWKVPPNAIEAELRNGAPDHVRIAALEQEMHSSLDVFEALLAGRDYLMADTITAADCAAFPFLKYGLWIEGSDDERFHRILADNLALDGGYPRVEEWVRRVATHPRVDGIVVYDG